MSAREQAWANRIAAAVMDDLAQIGRDDGAAWLTKPREPTRGIKLRYFGGPFPALQVSVESEESPEDGPGYDTDLANGSLIVYCMDEGGAKAEESVWDLAADVRRAITLDRNLGTLLGNGFIVWQKTECSADAMDRAGFAIAVVRFKYAVLSARTDP